MKKRRSKRKLRNKMIVISALPIFSSRIGK